MSNLNNLKPILESNINFETEQILKAAVFMAFRRTGTEPDKETIEFIYDDITNEFGHLETKQIIEALKNGGLGKYGRTYKLTIQEICIWIQIYIKENSPVKAFHPTVYE